MTEVKSTRGWTHDEAKQHSLTERLLERCQVYGGGDCSTRNVEHENWCERCLAVERIVDLEAKLKTMGGVVNTSLEALRAALEGQLEALSLLRAVEKAIAAMDHAVELAKRENGGDGSIWAAEVSRWRADITTGLGGVK